MKALLVGPESSPFVDVLRSKLRTEWELSCLDGYSPGDAPSAHFATAHALVSIRFNRGWPDMPHLKLVQAPATGLNNIDLEAVPAGVPVCNAYGHEVAIAEYVLFGMLACAHNILPIHREFSQGRWSWGDDGIFPVQDEIDGATVCLVGLGKIGIETAKRAKALGMRVLACNRSTHKAVPYVDELADLSHLAAFAARADFVVVNCALTDATRGIVDAKVLRAMKPSAFIINVSRGPLIEEQALFAALSSRQIAGAVLDVWYRYPDAQQKHPRPSAFAFHELDNVIMTPHISGWTHGMVQKRWAEVAQNMDNLAAVKPLINVVKA
jgi:phosphoglycerate dehydrogenase-like enzyme